MGMSVEPWIVAWPRSARMPPPGRPMLPSSSCTSVAVRISLHAGGVLGPADRVADRAVRSGPLFASSVSATLRKVSRGVPQTCSTSSGV